MCYDCWGSTHKDFVRGGVDVSDFEDTVTHPKPAPKRARTRGCPGNDHGAHVYVWTTEHCNCGFSKRHGFHVFETYACAGCGKRMKTRKTEQYQKSNISAFRTPKGYSLKDWWCGCW